MAKKRMFTQKIIDSDAFVDMPLSTQALYFHLNMRADDDGFVNKPKGVQRLIGATDDDLKLLLAKRFIIGFESGVIVIKHWRMHNILRKDRYEPTQYQEELAQLSIKDNGSYTEWQPNGNQMATKRQPSIDKISIDKISIDNIYEQEFDEVWQLYPRKQGKENAKKAYIKARKQGVEKEEIVKGLNQYIAYIIRNKTEQRYIKQGSTWFNQKCWSDDYDNNGRSKGTKRTETATVRAEGEDDTWFFNH